MAYPSWPAGLPSPFAAGEPTYKPNDNMIRTQTESGPVKVRRRFTGKSEVLALLFVFTRAQRVIFNAFYETTLKEVLPFTWKDLRTGATANYRFIGPPSDRYVAGDGETPGAENWQQVEVVLEKLP